MAEQKQPKKQATNKPSKDKTEKKESYPKPPNGVESSNIAKNQGWSWSFTYETYEEYMKKISVDRKVKMDDVRDGRLRLLMILMKQFGYTQELNAMVNKIHKCIYQRLNADDMTPTDLYNVGILLEAIACGGKTYLEEEIPKIMSDTIDFMNIWKTKGVGLRAYGTNDLMLYLNRWDKHKRFNKMMDRGMDTLQEIMCLPMDNDLWKRCASIISGLARTMKDKQFDILTQISANIMDELAKDTVDAFKQMKDNADEALMTVIQQMPPSKNFARQDHEDAHPFPKLIFNRAKFKGEDWARETFCCRGNPIADLVEWKTFIEENNIDKKEWGFTHEAFGTSLNDIWEITEGDDEKELKDKLTKGDLVIGRDVGANYLGYLLALSDRINPLFQEKMSELFGDKHKAAPVKKMNRCQNKLRGKYANCGFPNAAELSDTIRCLVVFDDFNELLNGYKTLEKAFNVCRVKNGYILEEKDVSFGYRDALINVVFDAGFCKIVCEVQFTTDLFYKLRSKLHRYYTFHRCDDHNEMVTPCNKYVDKYVTTIIQQKKEEDEKKDDK